jgi:hypothetical protein
MEGEAVKSTSLTLPSLLLATLATLHAGRSLPGVPGFGKLRLLGFQPMESRGTMTSSD